MKDKSNVQKKIDLLQRTINVLRKIKRVVPKEAYFILGDGVITFYPPADGAMSRLLVGNFTRLLKIKPEIKKPWENAKELTATFTCAGITVKVFEYRTKNCVVVTKKVVIPAVEAREAQPERIEEQEVMVCDFTPDQVEA